VILLQDVTTADMIALAKMERDGVIYYEWDLAISPKVCAQDQLLIQGLCFPDTVRTFPSLQRHLPATTVVCEIRPPTKC
jgi:hypothetical protein